MRVIIKYIREYYQKEFNLLYFTLVILLTGAMIYLNYWHGLEKDHVAQGGWARSFSGYYLMYLIPFALAFFLQYFVLKERAMFHRKWFWLILLFAPAFFSFRVNFSFHEHFVYRQWEYPDSIVYLNSINWVVRVFVVLIPVWLIWRVKDRNNQPFYGSRKLSNLKPYLTMLAIMLPLIALASTQKDFLQMYPRAQVLNSVPFDTFSGKMKYLLYELCYGFDFVSIEFFFRGFLILSLLKICGTRCIIPVACFYCSIHLGKPMGEAISSFFGGTLLGIVSYRTGSIWGGLIVHLGIAWMMELGGFIGHLLN